MLLPVGFLIQTGVVGWRLELHFGKAALVTLVMFALAVAVGLLIGIVVFAAIVALR